MEKIIEKQVEYETYPSTSCTLEPNWWVFALRGALASAAGLVSFFAPLATVLTMTLMFGAYAVLDGVFNIISGMNRAQKGNRWAGLILSGILGVGVGLITLLFPQLAAIGLTAFFWTMVATWGISTGIFQLISAIRLRQEIRDEILLALSSFLHIVLGLILLALVWFKPLASMVTLGFLVGTDFLASGVVLLFLANKLFNRQRNDVHSKDTLYTTRP